MQNKSLFEFVFKAGAHKWWTVLNQRQSRECIDLDLVCGFILDDIESELESKCTKKAKYVLNIKTCKQSSTLSFVFFSFAFIQFNNTLHK